MRTRWSSVVIVGGAALAGIGAVVSVVYLLQPWRTCPDDDAPAACPMLATDASVLAVAMLVTVVAATVAIVTAVVRSPRRA